MQAAVEEGGTACELTNTAGWQNHGMIGFEEREMSTYPCGCRCDVGLTCNQRAYPPENLQLTAFGTVLRATALTGTDPVL